LSQLVIFSVANEPKKVLNKTLKFYEIRDRGTGTLTQKEGENIQKLDDNRFLLFNQIYGYQSTFHSKLVENELQKGTN
jgi:hypothetical protein